MKFAKFLLVILALIGAPAVYAQSTQGDMAKKAANPIANLMSITMQNNADFGIGPYSRTSNLMNFQPVIPLAGGKVITRTISPFAWNSLPAETSGAGRSIARGCRPLSWPSRTPGRLVCWPTTSGPTPGMPRLLT